MKLQEVQIPIAFAGGVDTRQDPKQVPVAKLLDLQNGVFTRETSIAKRNGYRSLGTAIETSGVTYRDAAALAARGDELILFAGDRSYSHRAEADAWSDAGPVASAIATETPLVRTSTVQTCPDAASLAGVSLVAWEDSRGGVWWALIEVATGRIVRAAAAASVSGQRPRCLAVGGLLHLLWAESAAGEIRSIVVDPGGLSATAAFVVTNDLLPGNPAFDACTTNRVDAAGVIAWVTAAGYRVGYLAPSGGLGTPLGGFPSVVSVARTVTAAGIAVDYNTTTTTGSSVSVVTTDGALIALDSYSANLISSGSGTVGAVGAVRLALAYDEVVAPDETALIGSTFVWAELPAAIPRDHLVNAYVFSDAGNAFVLGAQMRGCGIASRGFRDASGPCVWVVHDSTFFATYLCMRMAPGASTRCVSRTMPGVAVGLPARAHLPSVQGDGTRAHAAALPYHERLDTPGGAQFAESSIRLVELDFDAAEAWQTAQLGRGLYLAAACPLHYDGQAWTEWGFHYAPDNVAAPTLFGGGGLTPNTTYTYRFTYEWVDAQGELHRGPTSAGTVVPLGPTDNETIWQLPTLRITAKERVRLGVWRSAPGDTSVFRRVSSVDPSLGGANGYPLNVTTADTISFTDQMSDADWEAQEPLYTNGGISSNDPAPMAGSVLAAGKGRLFWTDPADGNLIRFSQQIAEGCAAEPVARLLLRVDAYGGPVTGIGVMDDVVIVFKESAIYVFGGPGPLANPDISADQFAFTAPALIPTDVGCRSPQSIAYTPLGLTFQSQRGVGLVTRDRQVANIGAPIEAYAGEPITRATLLPDRSQIVFLTTADRTLLFDFEHQQWSTFTGHAGLDGVVVGGVYHYLRPDGRVFQETPGQYLDGNLQIRLVLETAWVKLLGYLQGWQQIHAIMFLGEYKSPHTLRVSVQLDYEAGFGPPFSFPVDADYNPALYGAGAYGAGAYGGDYQNSTRYQRELHVGQACEAFRVRIEDIEEAGQAGASFELSEMLVTGGILANAYRLPATRRS